MGWKWVLICLVACGAQPEHLSPFTSVVVPQSGSSVHVVGTEVSFVVRLRDQFGQDLTSGGHAASITADAVHAGSTSSICIIEDLENGQYLVRFTPHVTGEHALFVYIQNVPVSSGPIVIEVIPDNENPSGRSSWVIGQSLHSAVAGDPVSFIVGVRDRFDSDIFVGGTSVEAHLLRHPDTLSDSTNEHDVAVIDNQDGTYSCEYNVTEAGLYSMVVAVNSESAPGSPFVVQVLPTVIGVDSILDTTPVVDEHVVAGQPFTLEFRSVDTFGNRRIVGGDNIEVIFVHVESRTVTAATTKDNNDGTYQISGLLTKSGEYHINVTCDELALPQSTEGMDFTVVPGPSNQNHATIKGSGIHTAIAGESAEFVLKMLDDYFNEAISGGDHVTATLTQIAVRGSMPTSAFIPIEINDEGNGTYVLTYTTSVAGEYTLHVQLEGADAILFDVQGSPSVVTVKPNKAVASHSFITGGKATLSAGSNLHFTLHSGDEFGNVCTEGGAEVTFGFSFGEVGETYEAKVVDSKNGLYVLKGTIFKAGVYTPVVELFGSKVLTNKTISVHHGPTWAGHCTAVVKEIETIEAGVLTKFSIKAFDAFGNPTKATDKAFTVSMTSGEQTFLGSFEKEFGSVRATRAGPATLSIQFDGKDVINSPHELVIVGSLTSPLHTHAIGEGLMKTSAGKATQFSVLPLDEFDNPSTKGVVDVEIRDSDNELVPTEFEDKNDSYLITYTPTNVGLYVIKISVNGTQISSSPFSVVVEPGPTASEASQILGRGISEGLVAKENEFVVVARDQFGNLRGSGGDKVVVQTKSAKGLARSLDVKVVDTGSGTYKVSYIAPPAETTLTLVVEVNGKPVGETDSHDVVITGAASLVECLDNCNGNGECNSMTGLCSCVHGWAGPSCSVLNVPCPRDCSQHGYCNPQTGSCLCHKGYSGADCGCYLDECVPTEPILIRTGPCDQNCSGHGVCLGDEGCRCNTGFTGSDCATRTKYAMVPLLNGMVILYEVASGRMFGYLLNTFDDKTCAGLEPLNPDFNPRLWQTDFIQRKPNQHLVSIGENSVLEIDPVGGRVFLLAFKASDLTRRRLTQPTTREISPQEPLFGKQIVFMPTNRLLVSTPSSSEVWLLNRQDPELITERLTTLNWNSDSLPGNYFYSGEDRIGRYLPSGQYELFLYDAVGQRIQEPAVASGQLGYLSDLRANTSLVVLAIKQTWIAFDPFTSEYRSFYCPHSEGLSGCTVLNKGSFLNGFECPLVPETVGCENLTVSDCIQSDRCGYCAETHECLPGVRSGPVAGKFCPASWIFSTPPFRSSFHYMGQSKIFNLDTNGKYSIWALDSNPRSRFCPALADTQASGFVDAAHKQVLFDNENQIVLNTRTGEYRVGSCSQSTTTAECTLKCETWHTDVSEGLKFRNLAVLSTSPTILLDFSQRTGEYRVWKTSTKREVENGDNYFSEKLYQGRAKELRSAEVTTLLNYVLAHQHLAGSTTFFSIGPSYQLDFVTTVLSSQEFSETSEVSLAQYKYVGLGGDRLLQYSNAGLWKVLKCSNFPIDVDLFGGRAPFYCMAVGSGTSSPPRCVGGDEESCTKHPLCGWCGTTQTCHLGYEKGVCNRDEPNCPEPSWVYHGPKSKEQPDTTGCAKITNCRGCVSNSSCGWHAPTRSCTAGNPVGPFNKTLELDPEAIDWNFFYCTGEDSCSNLHSCNDCVGLKYCGWCPSLSRCMVASHKGPSQETCEGFKVTEQGLAGFMFGKCAA